MIPKRIRRFDFSGTNKQLRFLLVAFGSKLPSETSSIRIQITPYEPGKRGQLARFFSLRFPGLSELDIEGFLPDPSSTVFTTSSLTSLKLSTSYTDEGRYTLSQISQVLQQHPNLQELGLKQGALPPTEKSTALLPVVLPRLVDLQLHGAKRPILQFTDIIDMSSPLHNVAIRIRYSESLSDTSLARAVKKIVARYYKCKGLGHPRELHCLKISLNKKGHLIFDTQSCCNPASNLRSHLKLQFDGAGEFVEEIWVDRSFPFFPLNDVRELSIEGLDVSTDEYRRMFQKSTELSHLRVTNLDIKPLLEALDLGYQGAFKKTHGVMSSHSRARR